MPRTAPRLPLFAPPRRHWRPGLGSTLAAALAGFVALLVVAAPARAAECTNDALISERLVNCIDRPQDAQCALLETQVKELALACVSPQVRQQRGISEDDFAAWAETALDVLAARARAERSSGGGGRQEVFNRFKETIQAFRARGSTLSRSTAGVCRSVGKSVGLLLGRDSRSGSDDFARAFGAVDVESRTILSECACTSDFLEPGFGECDSDASGGCDRLAEAAAVSSSICWRAVSPSGAVSLPARPPAPWVAVNVELGVWDNFVAIWTEVLTNRKLGPKPLVAALLAWRPASSGEPSLAPLASSKTQLADALRRVDRARLEDWLYLGSASVSSGPAWNRLMSLLEAPQSVPRCAPGTTVECERGPVAVASNGPAPRRTDAVEQPTGSGLVSEAGGTRSDGAGGSGQWTGPGWVMAAGATVGTVGLLIMGKACDNFSECRGIDAKQTTTAEATRYVSLAGWAAAGAGLIWGLVRDNHPQPSTRATSAREPTWDFGVGPSSVDVTVRW
jgi:hypothetical protein